jgi:hypothetical protein
VKACREFTVLCKLESGVDMVQHSILREEWEDWD